MDQITSQQTLDSASLDAALREISDWLIGGARSAQGPAGMMEQTCERLVEAGLPLWRVAVYVQTLHPDIFGRHFIWRPGAEVVVGTESFDIEDSEDYKNSPLLDLYENDREVRYRLDDPASRRFPFFDDMRAEGVTDYIALPLRFIEGSLHASSWTTKQPGGFTDAQLDGLRQIVQPLARMVEIIGIRRMATTLLETYVGGRAGERILAGQIRRGHTETMHAAIWLSDLRGFTALSDRLPPEAVVSVLNDYFDCQVGPIREHGGEVLKFMGDGLLAVFPIAEDLSNARDVCGNVVAAARQVRAKVHALQCDTETVSVGPLRFGVALHVGKILYGNIGGGGRQDFTCIGPAINLAARLEKIAGQLGRTVVGSAKFASKCPSNWTELGDFPIAGIAREEKVFGLQDETPVH